MLIIGIAGSLCSGKKTLANLLKTTGDYDLLINDSSSETLTLDTIDLSSQSKIAEKLSKGLEKSLIIYPISNFADLISLQSDSRFILISIDTPIRLRYQRYVKNYGKTVESLRTFIEKDDFMLYSAGLSQIIKSADRILHNSGTMEELCNQICNLDVLKMVNQRPSFDLYFVRIAELVSTRSGCLVNRGGCVLTHTNKIIATGFTGIPSSKVECVDGGCEICLNRASIPCICSHAEINAIVEAKQQKLHGCTVYLKFFPCLQCAQAIIQIKAKRLIYSDASSLNPSIESYIQSTGIEVKYISVLG